MTEIADLMLLLEVSEVTYDRQRQALAVIAREESRLRQDLARLDALDASDAPEADRGHGMRAVGADILWQGWLARTRTRINMELARVLARKAHEQARLRKAFGRVDALRQLIGAENGRQRKQAEAQNLESAIEIALRSPQ